MIFITHSLMHWQTFTRGAPRSPILPSKRPKWKALCYIYAFDHDLYLYWHEDASLGEGRCFTHCGWENDNAEYIHLLTAAWASLILDVWRWREFQQHRSTLWIVVIRHQVNKIWASSVHWCFYDGNKVCLILKKKIQKQLYIFLRKCEWCLLIQSVV